ncbi:9282_t:CDS:2 [Funneliformis caledonium]|uniref:Histone H1 n=1 Tax=Funneliformis caledonium TaxID=1117310 RepID=A0A9N9DZI7_9GLOM|nr:9282_t:CDS:2 [Funneliformis caledonium]
MDLHFAQFYHQKKLINNEIEDLEILSLYQKQQEKFVKNKNPVKGDNAANKVKYEIMVRDAIIALKEPNGSLRQAIKDFLINTYKLPDRSSTNKRFRMAINKGIEKGIFYLPAGPKGPVKLTNEHKIKKEEPDNEELLVSLSNGQRGTI